jgi:hypothetical protein
MHFDPARTTPIGLSRYAKEFLDAALAADETVGERPGYEIHAPVPIMYLVGHAIELSLKAYLAFMDVSLTELASKKANELGLVVSVQQERSDLGWPRKEAKTLEVPSHNICHLSHDIFYETFFYISSPSTGRSTNLGALTNESYIYSVADSEGKQVVTITEADSRTKRLFESKRDYCVEDEAK